MKIARIAGTVTATVKDKGLSGMSLLLANVEHGSSADGRNSLVVADTCGAGPGDLVLLAEGSAARLPSRLAGSPVDAAVVGIIDQIDISPGVPPESATTRRTTRNE